MSLCETACGIVMLGAFGYLIGTFIAIGGFLIEAGFLG